MNLSAHWLEDGEVECLKSNSYIFNKIYSLTFNKKEYVKKHLVRKFQMYQILVRRKNTFENYKYTQRKKSIKFF